MDKSQDSTASSAPEGMVNPAVRNEGAMRFLLTRRSRPPKTLTLPAPDQSALTEILTAALRVPDHGKLEPWRLIVLERNALDRLAQQAAAYAKAQGLEERAAQKGVAQFADSPLCVAVIAAPKASDKVPEIEQVLSAGALCLGVVNAALAAGWGAGWLTSWVAHDSAFATPTFGLAPGEWVAGLVHIGTETMLPPERPRPDLTKVVTWMSR